MSTARNKSPASKDFVFGLGATGLSIARYLQRKNLHATFFDTRDEPPGLDELKNAYPNAELLFGDAQLPGDIVRVIASPGISDAHPLLAAARAANIEIVSDIELFAREAKSPFIAVTGSNGKSTVTTLLYYMIRAAGFKAYAGGNLGEPALDLLNKELPDVYVLELSSFQLQRTQSLPAEIAILLNVATDHLDWHADEDEYRQSKYRVYREAKAAVFNRADPVAVKMVDGLDAVISFGLDEPGDNQYGLLNEDGVTYLARGDTLLISTQELALYGKHNQANALAALAAGELAGLEIPEMLQVLCEFPGLKHRMQYVDRVAAVDYVNDSKATNVAAAIASIESVDSPLVLIAGGDGKGGNFAELANALEDKFRAAVLIGKDAENISAALDTVDLISFAQDMTDAVQQAAAFAEAGDTVLLAPACASTDQYQNYEARGEAFANAVWELGR